MRYALVDGQGNFGSVDGDPPAAMRYTEARLKALAEALMVDLDKDTVDFVPNYDETTEEPTVLPAPFRTCSSTVRRGSRSAWPRTSRPQPGEVIDCVVWAIEHPEATADEKLSAMWRILPGPDFRRRVIIGRAGIAQAYRTGRGSVVTRARTRSRRRRRATARRLSSPRSRTR